jgi:phage gp46-like protein
MDIGLFVIDGCLQLKLEDGDLAEDKTLETAVAISLFTNRRITDAELPAGIESKQGWWGDLFPPVEDDQIGSKLWLLERGKITNGTLAAVETYAIEALNWMIEDGVAATVEASADFVEGSTDRIQLAVTITRPTGEADVFSLIWDEQELRRG